MAYFNTRGDFTGTQACLFDRTEKIAISYVPVGIPRYLIRQVSTNASDSSIVASGFVGVFSPVHSYENKIAIGESASRVRFENASRWKQQHRWRDRDLPAVRPVAVPDGDSWGLLLLPTLAVLAFAKWHSSHWVSVSPNLPHSI